MHCYHNQITFNQLWQLHAIAYEWSKFCQIRIQICTRKIIITFQVNHLDIAPLYAPILMGISNTVNTFESVESISSVLIQNLTFTLFKDVLTIIWSWQCQMLKVGTLPGIMSPTLTGILIKDKVSWLDSIISSLSIKIWSIVSNFCPFFCWSQIHTAHQVYFAPGRRKTSGEMFSSWLPQFMQLVPCSMASSPAERNRLFLLLQSLLPICQFELLPAVGRRGGSADRVRSWERRAEVWRGHLWSYWGDPRSGQNRDVVVVVVFIKCINVDMVLLLPILMLFWMTETPMEPLVTNFCCETPWLLFLLL